MCKATRRQNPCCASSTPKQALLTGSRVLTPSSTFLQLEGEGNDGIIVEGGDLSKAASAVAFKNGASEQSVKLRNLT